MPETRSHAGRADPSGRAEAGTPELQARIGCREKDAGSVLEEIHDVLRKALVQGRDPLILLEDLRLLKDSVSNLIKGLSRLLVDYPRTVTLWESSGYTEAFLSVIDAPAL